MNFLALLLGLGIERGLTHYLHLRAFHWLDPLFDQAFARLSAVGRHEAIAALALLAVVLSAPVILVSTFLAGSGDQWLYFLFAIFVLLFSLGPRDLQEEVEEYCGAAEGGAMDDAEELGRELAERDIGTHTATAANAVRRAIFIQANNRIFGVVFWFLLLGPAGAWLFRVLDLVRQRASATAVTAETLAATRRLHGAAAWIPGRLMAGGFALSGSFLGATTAWREFATDPEAPFFERTETLVADIGEGACSDLPEDQPVEPAWLARSALSLVLRTLWLIWYPAIALLTLGNWLQ